MFRQNKRELLRNLLYFKKYEVLIFYGVCRAQHNPTVGAADVLILTPSLNEPVS